MFPRRPQKSGLFDEPPSSSFLCSSPAPDAVARHIYRPDKLDNLIFSMRHADFYTEPLSTADLSYLRLILLFHAS